MISFENVQTIDGKKTSVTIQSAENISLDATGLTLFPALIDPHVHFRTPGLEYKEDWQTAAKASIAGGYTTVFDMPNTIPPTITADLLHEKMQIINAQLKAVDIPLNYGLFFGADKNHFDQITKVKNDIVGIKVFMGCSTGNMVIDDDESLHAIFEIAGNLNLLVAVHAEDEHLIKQRKQLYKNNINYATHSEIRNTEVAAKAVEKAIMLSKRYRTRLYILHISSRDEIGLIKQAKTENLPVYAETTPHHLFLNTTAYQKLQGRAVMNPPLRAEEDQIALFEAIENNIIDTIGSDHAPHTLTEKALPYSECACGVPGIETTLPLLLNAYHQNKISLEKIVALTAINPRHIFNLPETKDIVLVDLNHAKIVDESVLYTKCHWSPFAGMKLKGWPKYLTLAGRMFSLR